MPPRKIWYSVAIPNPDHLFEQAEKLIKPPRGRPREVDLRRAISAAYYGVFHATLTEAADLVVGAARRGTPLYGLVYRSVDHRALLDLCEEAQKPVPKEKYRPYFPAGGFSKTLIGYATAVVNLQEKRHEADYDPTATIRSADSQAAVQLARGAVAGLQQAHRPERARFLHLLLFRPR